MRSITSFLSVVLCIGILLSGCLAENNISMANGTAEEIVFENCLDYAQIMRQRLFTACDFDCFVRLQSDYAGSSEAPGNPYIPEPEWTLVMIAEDPLYPEELTEAGLGSEVIPGTALSYGLRSYVAYFKTFDGYLAEMVSVYDITNMTDLPYGAYIVAHFGEDHPQVLTSLIRINENQMISKTQYVYNPGDDRNGVLTAELIVGINGLDVFNIKRFDNKNPPEEEQ